MCIDGVVRAKRVNDAMGRVIAYTEYEANSSLVTSKSTGYFVREESSTRAKRTNTPDFDQSYQPINSAYPGGAATGYMVQAGDTLSSIAQSVWGDAALWYLIADANGLSADTEMVAGQRISIPNKVANFHNNSGTFRVYDPGQVCRGHVRAYEGHRGQREPRDRCGREL